MRAGGLMAVLGPFSVAGQPVAAQRYASLAGHVLDTSGGGISGAVVTVTNQETGFRRSAESEIGGAYAVSPLEAGLLQNHRAQRGIPHPGALWHALGGSAGRRGRFRAPGGQHLETVTVEGVPSPLDREDAAPKPPSSTTKSPACRSTAGACCSFSMPRPAPMSRPPRAAKPGNSPPPGSGPTRTTSRWMGSAPTTA
jgi:hypothetical protein